MIRPSARNRLFLGVSATALMLAGTSAVAQDMFRKAPRTGAQQASQAAAQAATRNRAITTATQRTIQAFARASAVRQRMDAAQAAARAAAMAAQSTVPNGLGAGGLQVANGVSTDPSLWIGAGGPTQSQGSDGRTKVQIGQTQAKAILTWDSFNIGRETDLTFNQQGNTNWVALNRVTDVHADPSKILGSIRADGTVLILNRNGVIFGGSSQVNTRNLVAAAANISNDQFLTRGIYSASEFGRLMPSFTAARGDVRVEAGAQITTRDPASVTQGGGYVLLLGANVENAGSITTNRGQTLLAAGDDFLVRPGLSTDANQYSSTRGNEVNTLRGTGSLSGAVTNSGLISAARGDITLTGHAVTQAGVALSTTSVNQRGTIHLLNSASDATGSVTLAAGSLTTILPELASTETAVNTQRDALIADSAKQDLARTNAVITGRDNLAQFDNLSRLSDRRDQSRVEIVTGGNAVFAGDSITLAQGGQVSVSAVSRVQVQSGAEINVSGVRDVMLDPSSNAIRVNIQGNELRDSPANREGALLNNQNVWVDVRDLIYVPDGVGGYRGERYYTPGGLLEVGGSLGLQQHGIGEWAAIGGTITLQAREVVAERGATFDISGGSLNYAAGSVPFSRLLDADGRLRDIGDASAFTQFLAVGNAQVVKHARWGAHYTEIYSNPLFSRGNSARWEDGYTVGRDAGKLIIAAPTVVLEADILADVVRGNRQTLARPAGVTDGYKLSQDVVARAGTLAIGRIGGLGADDAFDSEVVIGAVADITGAPATGALPAERINTVLLDADRLSRSRLGGLSITTGDSVTIDRALTLADGGALTVTAAVTTINADVTARGGSITVGNLAPASAIGGVSRILTRDGTSSFTLNQGATLDLRGVWTNSLDNADRPSTALVNGGDLSVRMARGSITLARGSMVDVSSGATLFADASLTGGRGGNVSLIAGASLDTAPEQNPGGVRLTLDGDIRAQGVVGGGKLMLQSPTTVVFGEDSFLAGGVLPVGTAAPTALILARGVTIPVGGVVPIGRTDQLDVTFQDFPLPTYVFPTNRTPIVTGADWTLPVGVSLTTTDGRFFSPGSRLPGGSTIASFSGNIPQGTVLPSTVFSHGISVQNYNLSLAAGAITPITLRYDAGQLVTRGVRFAEDVAFEPALNIAPSILRSGFSDYRVTSLGGLQITEGVALRPEVPVLRLAAAARTVATGGDPLAALESWTPPVYLEDPAHGRLTRRAGANLSLRAVDLGMAAGSGITVDPGSEVRLAAAGQITINGSITAPGGTIAILSESVGVADAAIEGIKPGTSIWIGEHAALDATGRAVTALDRNGRRYGIAPDGGSIRIGVNDMTPVDRDFLGATRAHVVIRNGATLNGSGAVADIDVAAGGVPGAVRATRIAGNGGMIRIGSAHGIINDGAMRAASGGGSAAGGTLNLVLENLPGAYGVSVLTIGQHRTGGGLSDGLAPGVADPLLAFGTARLSVEEIAAGGFGTLDLWSRDAFSFAGNVDLTMSESLILRRGVLSVSDLTPTARVSLAAPYVLLHGKVGVDPEPEEILPGLIVGGRYGDNLEYDPSLRNAGLLTVRADLIDVRGRNLFGASGAFQRGLPNFQVEGTLVDFAGFASVDLASSSDIRFTDGGLASAGDMTLTAAQLYPTTGAWGSIGVGRRYDPVRNDYYYDPDSVLTIRGQGGPAPAAPLSVFGKMTLIATTIDQGGIIRAPLGRMLFGVEPGIFNPIRNTAFDVILRAGSVTSVSADGLTLPYGGTADGLTYLYNGQQVSFLDLARLAEGDYYIGALRSGMLFGRAHLTAETGSLLDLSGGGKLTGAGFFTGRGGSVDVLRTTLANANPAFFGNRGGQVYAIVPGYAGDYAPVQPDSGFGAPGIGRQITFDHPVGGLPAGTYTLMPSTFALLPGAFRVELGDGGLAEGPTVALPDGSFRSGGYLGVANTSARDILPTGITVTPANKVRTFSQYNETSYADFAIANAATFGALRPRLERDASVLQIDFGRSLGEVLDFNGTANLGAAQGGTSGTLFVTGDNAIEVKASGDTSTAGFTSIDASDLSKFNAGTLVVGGTLALIDAVNAPDFGGNPLGPRITFESGLQTVAVRDGATLSAGQIFLTGRDVLVESGAVLDTTHGPTNGISSTLGYVFSDTYNNRDAIGGAILTVANGFIDFTAPLVSSTHGVTSITVEDGAALRTLGTIGFSTNGPVTLGEAEFNARYLALAVPTLNIGTAKSFADAEAAGVLGAGVRLSQGLLERLLRPTVPGQMAVERISLTAGGSINLFGNVAIDLRATSGGTGAALVLNTPALYGWGNAGNVARISTDTLIWNGIATGSGVPASPFASSPPGAVTPGGAGTGSGALTIDARRIEFGYDPLARAQDQAALDRLALGFSTVNLNASERVTANNRGTLAVYATGTDAASYAGGTLNITAPVLTGEAGSFMAYRSGGALTVTAPAGAAFDTATIGALGAEVRLAGGSVTVDSAVALPSGRLVIDAAGAITLTDRADIDLSGRAVRFFDATKYSWGGDLVMESVYGGVTQAAGSTIDISAINNVAGAIKVTATGTGGLVDLAGNITGTGTAGFDSGAIDIRARALSDFAGLNHRLNTGGLFEARGFVVKTGDLIVGDEVRAQRVTISADGGSLTVNGRIDAGGRDVGTIRLAARDDLTLAAGAVLDTHGTVLATDSYGAAIEASNRGEVELTSMAGSINLARGATIDLRSADGVARGRLEINAPRLGGNDVAVNAVSGLVVNGADSIAVNAFASYTPANGVIDQAYLDTLHVDSTAFIDAANANGAVTARLAGLKSYGTAFHLRPGVEIRSAGDLTVSRELDFSGYRYGPGADPALRGSGEPGVVTIRAGGTLTINGSISDGFAPPPETPDDNGWLNREPGPDGRQGQMVAMADMLAPGMLSWSMRLVGGGDLSSADSRTLAAKSTLGEGGDVLLDDAHTAGPGGYAAISVVRTGTGYLDVLAGGDYRQNSLFGVYTAGTQIAGSDAWNLARGTTYDGSVLGLDFAAYEATLNPQRMFFTEGGGDLMLAAQGDVRGFIQVNTNSGLMSDDIGKWLWRQGGASLNQQTAWGINFGQYWSNVLGGIEQAGFSGIGTLGGGDVSVIAGGDAGLPRNADPDATYFTTSGLNIMVGGSGRMDPRGVLSQTGGGTLKLDIGGRYNTGRTLLLDPQTGAGQVVNIRGDTAISAGSIGQTLEAGYGLKASGDPRAVDTRTPLDRIGYGAPVLVIGDGVARVNARGDLVMQTGRDAGRVPLRGGNTAGDDGSVTGLGATSFTLWTDRSAIAMFAGGGDIIQSVPAKITGGEIFYDPAGFSAVAANGSISTDLRLAPSRTGALELLAHDGLFGAASMSSAAPDNLATPQNPLWGLGDGFSIYASNAYSPEANTYDPMFDGASLFTFGPDTATNLHAGATDPIRLYAVNGDIMFNFGTITDPDVREPRTFYVAAKPVRMRAGRDILAKGLILNNDPDDISIVRAGRDILNTTLKIAGPGTLEVTAGRNIYQALSTGSTIDSIGPIVSGDARDGASIALIAGVGAGGPDYAGFAARYLNAANLADAGRPLADQPGKVVKTYDRELLAWLKDRFGYAGDAAGALGYFQALPEEQQGVFVRHVYFEELRQGGREYNDPDSRRFASYLRGSNAIAALLPEKDATGQDIAYQGSITYLGAAGTHTDFGGDIQILVPGGGLTLGATGVAPPATTGLLTQGSGDIEVFARDSVLLGLSRVFTTFGGDITMWSARGDINAGRGAKGTVVFAPAKRLYDIIGNVDLSPTVPTSGAGIGTLNPIAEVAPGNIDLIAPLGTIDAGEAGIRVSGDINLAALQVINAANIDVQGEATGIPAAAAVNTGALTAASAATTAVVNEAARLAERARPAVRSEMPTILNVRFLGFGPG
ncbi:filamentous haemagglutinin family protein [Sphingomonas sp.]|uniref:filamentous haemagglutinin family protein n=1 Tax=Sphingomonas sp. TaxID=28214 RepID=UPI003D6CF2EA